MNTIYLALGSNVGNKKLNIKNAVDALKMHITNIKVAELYETKPMYFEEQDRFVNTVIKGETDLKPEELLKFVKTIEKELGRQKRFRNGPREIDIDILFYDQLKLENSVLILPHPRIKEREFVLKPFIDLDPEFIHPVLKKTMQEIYNELMQ